VKNRRRLPIPQYEFSFVAETFNLFQDFTTDGERIAREQAEAEQARLVAEKAQVALPQSKTNEQSPIRKSNLRLLPRPSRGGRVSGRSVKDRNGSRNKVSRVSHSRRV